MLTRHFSVTLNITRNYSWHRHLAVFSTRKVLHNKPVTQTLANDQKVSVSLSLISNKCEEKKIYYFFQFVDSFQAIPPINFKGSAAQLLF